MSPGKLQEVEQGKLDKISSLASSLLELKKKQCELANEKNNLMKEAFEKQKSLRLKEYQEQSVEMDEREKELCKKTNQLLADLVSTSDESPFNKALIQILGNMKGTFNYCL